MLAAIVRELASSLNVTADCAPRPAAVLSRRRLVFTAAALLLLALVPRAVVAVKAEYLCPDGTYYVLLARQQEQGDLALPLVPDVFNVFPQILRGLHRLGLPWETGAKLWNVLCGATVVLPLWGWLRRQFNDRLALGAAVLCAVHPKLIEWSGEVIREPTFWLCFFLALYAGWRGAAENRASWWGAAGLAAALATQTRMEGWLLALPLGAWWLGRMVTSGGRLRLALGLTLLLAAYPAVVAPINLAVHGGAQPYQWGAGLHRLMYVRSWLEDVGEAPSPRESAPPLQPAPPSSPPALAANGVEPSDSATNPPPSSDPLSPADASQALPPAPPVSPVAVAQPTVAPVLPPMLAAAEAGDTFTRRDAVRIYARALVRGLTPAYLVLTALGLVWNWRRALGWDQLPLLGVAAVTLAAIWIHLAEAHLTSSRYWLVVVLTLSPWTAAGLFDAAQRLPWRSEFTASAALTALALFGWGYAAALPTDAGRQSKAELGQWVADHLGTGKRVVGTPRLKMIEYYAQAMYQILPQPNANDPDWNAWITGQQPDLVALSSKDLSPAAIDRVAQRLVSQGWQPIPAESLPRSCRTTSVVLARRAGAWR